MKRILIVDAYPYQKRLEFIKHNIPTASLLFDNILRKFSIKLNIEIDTHIVNSCDNTFILKDFESFDGCIWTGSSLSIINDKNNINMSNNYNLMKNVIKNNIPIIGSCFGLQLLNICNYGSVKKNPLGREIGIGRQIYTNNKNSIYNGKNIFFDTFTTHNDIIEKYGLNTQILSTNKFGIQGMKFNINNVNHYGFQYHMEFDTNYMSKYLRLRKKSLLESNIFNSEMSIDLLIYLLECLSKNIDEEDVISILGLDRKLLDDKYRLLELENWFKKL